MRRLTRGVLLFFLVGLLGFLGCGRKVGGEPSGTEPNPPPAGCSTCHGSADNAAPPKDTSGNTATTAIGVGAHQSHLQTAHSLSSPVACEECHIVPPTVGASGHLNGLVEIFFGSLATAGGAAPVWDPTTATCSGAYCHGATLGGGGSMTTPVWTQVDGSQVVCGTCHGLPPPSPHPGSDQCASCHPETVNAAREIAHPDKHIDGQVEVTGGLACNSCHGSADNPAPPPDTSGNTATTAIGVGAHQSHLKAAHALSAPLTCGECHVVPATVGAAGHNNGAVEIVFGALARSHGAAPLWNPATARCAGAYCHGATLAAGSLTSPLWTQVDGSQIACGTCHGVPPNTGRHPSNFEEHAFMDGNCTYCHAGMTNTTGTSVQPALHINGTADVNVQGGSWNQATLTCSPPCHGPESWAGGDGD